MPTDRSAAAEFDHARAVIGRIAARAHVISEEELAYISERLETDPFLSRIHPM
jgi:hypothetical protein